MKNEHKKHLTLAIETAVLGGSISLLRDGAEIDSMSGGTDVSRSEDILANIDELLRKNNSGPSEICLIAVSTGPGSYTGIRVGIATALGLKNALNIECVGVEVLRSMAISARSGDDLICAVPIGREEVCWQSFQAGVSGPIKIEKQDAFVERLRTDTGNKSILHERLYASFTPNIETARVLNAGTDLARYIGLAAIKGEALGSLEPIYIRDNI